MAITSKPLAAPKAPHANCHECPLAAKPFVPTKPCNNPKAALVSRSPGYHEVKYGEHFSGPSGQIVNFLLNEQGVKREEVLLTNVVLCSPDEGKVPPEAIKACAPRLDAELADCDLVIAAGSEAVNLLIGRGSIDRYRGYRITDRERTLVATNNPFLVVRDDSAFPNLRRDFKRAFNPLPPPTLPTVQVIEDIDEARSFIKDTQKRSERVIAADIESRGGLSHKATLVSMQFAMEASCSFVIGERGGIWEDQDFIERDLRPFLESTDHVFVWHNGKFDTKVLKNYGINARVDEDTMLMSYACDERSGASAKEHGGIHKLESLLAEEFGWPDYEPESVKRFKKSGLVEDYDELYEYAGRDAGGTYQLYQLFSERIRTEKVEQPYRKLLLRGSAACSRIERAGFRYDVNTAADIMENEVKPELEAKTANLQELINDPLYNPRSPVRTATLFYDTWKITHEMRGRPDKNRSTDDAALNEIIAGRFETRFKDERSAMIEFAKELKRFRELSKQADTYILGLIERAILDPDGRIYTDLLLHGTTSGRLSSRNPNLQNITRTKAGLPNIRRLFLPSPGRVIVQADYSQAELRCIAQFSQDPKLLEIYHKDLSLHNETATRFYGEGYTSEQYSTSKNVNFGVAYGQSAASFQEKHEIPEKEAQKYIDWFWTYFTGIKKWKNDIIAEMRTGRVVSPFGRVRRFHLLTKENFNASVREAVNFKPQSTAGDLTLCSVNIMADEIDWSKSAIVITVHDSIVGDVQEGYVDEYRTICKQIMESRAKDELGWNIPFKVEIGVGPNWAEAK